MSPIRIGFIGLSANPCWGSMAHLPYINSSSKYTIIGLLNSTADASHAAIKAHDLPSSTKVYKTADDLAADADVDLVVCSVRVDLHYQTMKPSIAAGKNVYCEWPLAKNSYEAAELTKLAETKGSKVMIGLQGRVAPWAKKVKELVESGAIGKVHSSSVLAAGMTVGKTLPKYVRYLTERKVGGNLSTINNGHIIDTVQFVLGEISTHTSLLKLRRENITILDNWGGNPVETIKKDTHDQILVQGTLDSGAVFSYHNRSGDGFLGKDLLVWNIYGEDGEIQINESAMLPWMAAAGENVTVQLYKDGETKKVELEIAKEFEALPAFAQNVAPLYEAFAEGKTEVYADWKLALKRHQFIHELYQREGLDEY